MRNIILGVVLCLTSLVCHSQDSIRYFNTYNNYKYIELNTNDYFFHARYDIGSVTPTPPPPNPFEDAYQVFNYYDSIGFTTDKKKLYDYKQHENISLIQSNCLNWNATNTYIEFTHTEFNPDSNFYFTFYLKNTASATSTVSPLFCWNGTDRGFRFIPAATAGNSYLYAYGTLGSVNKFFTKASSSVFTKIGIRRIGNYMSLLYDDVKLDSMNLGTIGSMASTDKIRINPQGMYIYDFNLRYGSNNQHIIQSPFAQGYYGKYVPVINFKGNNGTCTSSGNVATLGKQDNYHFNLQNGYSFYVVTTTMEELRMPFVNGIPLPATDSMWFVLNNRKFVHGYDFYPGLTQFIETKLLMDSNNVGLTNTYTWANPSGVRMRDLFSIESKAFIDNDSTIPALYTFTNPKTQSEVFSLDVDTIDVWFLAGQSNASFGSATVDSLPDSLKTYTAKSRMFGISDTTFRPLIPSLGWHNPGFQYPEFSISLPFQELQKDKYIWFIQYAVGNTQIYQDAVATDWNIHSTNEYYHNLIDAWTKAIRYIDRRGIIYRYKGMIWYQGEKDGDLGGAALTEYKQNTIDLINAFRDTIGYEIPVYLGEVTLRIPAYGTIRTAQAEIANEMNKVVLIDADNKVHVDNLHLTSKGKVQFAQDVINNLIE